MPGSKICDACSRYFEGSVKSTFMGIELVDVGRYTCVSNWVVIKDGDFSVFEGLLN